jgi:hypothetical protein
MNIEDLADALIAQQHQIDTLIGYEAAYRAMVASLIATHPDKPALREQVARAREWTLAKSLGACAQDSSVRAAESLLDDLERLLNRP